VPDDEAMVKASSSLAELDDSRLVVLSDADVLEDWEASLINSEACQWAFAEGIVNEKRSKTISSLLFSIKLMAFPLRFPMIYPFRLILYSVSMFIVPSLFFVPENVFTGVRDLIIYPSGHDNIIFDRDVHT
jgi:hypothetical protein